MHTGQMTVDAPMIAKEFYLIGEILGAKGTAGELQRWLEYQAYAELVRLVSATGTLPAEYEFENLDMKAVGDWIRSGKNLGFSFVERIRKLLLELQAAGSGVFGDICNFYCAYKNKLDGGFTATSMALGSAELATMLAHYKLDILVFHGIPVTAFASLAIKFGILDDICDCANRGG